MNSQGWRLRRKGPGGPLPGSGPAPPDPPAARDRSCECSRGGRSSRGRSWMCRLPDPRRARLARAARSLYAASGEAIEPRGAEEEGHEESASRRGGSRRLRPRPSRRRRRTPGADASRVSIPLSEYEGLRRLQERPSVTVVGHPAARGSFKNRDLTVLLSGRSAGNLPAADILSGASGIVLHGCDGDAIVSRRRRRCLPAHAARGALQRALSSGGAGQRPRRDGLDRGRAVGGVGRGRRGARAGSRRERRSSAVLRRAPRRAASEGLKASATGRYKITLRPDETRFRYEILVHNPNRSRQAFDVILSSGEHLQQVDAEVPYEARANRYRFDVPPGEVTLALSGQPVRQLVPAADRRQPAVLRHRQSPAAAAGGEPASRSASARRKSASPPSIAAPRSSSWPVASAFPGT